MAYPSDHETQALSLIRDWRAYLRARRIIMGQAVSANAFERDNDSLASEEAEADIAALGQERRLLFENAFQERRAAWQAVLEAEQPNSTASIFLDQALVEQRALEECLELVEGQRHPDGPGYVRYPALAGDPLTWHDAFLPQLDTLPDEAAYRLSQRHGKRRERLLRIGAGILLLPMCVLLLWTIFAPETAPAHTADESPSDYELTVWPQAGLLIDGDTISQTLPLTRIDGQAWPDDGQAYMLAGARIPAQLCIPGAALEAASHVHILGDGINPERIYSLHENGSTQPDLLIVSCGQAGHIRKAYLSDIKATAAAQLGDTLNLDGHIDITLEQVVVRGPAEDSSIPEQSMRVILRLSGVLSDSTAPDWSVYAPTLVLLDGSLQAAPQIALRDQAVELSYLVKSQHSLSEAELRLSNTAGRNMRWRFALALPPDRSTLLGKALQIESMKATTDVIDITVNNQGNSDFVLQASDFSITQQELPFAHTTIIGIDAALTPGETRHIQIALPEEAIGELTLSIGPYRYRVVRR